MPWRGPARRGGEVVGGQGGGDLAGEAVGPTVAVGAGEGDQLLMRGGGQRLAGRPALEQPQHGRGAQVIASDGQGGREGGDEVLAQPVTQPTLVSGGALVVAGDGAQLPSQRPVGDQRAQGGVAVQGQQAADAGVLGVVLLAGGPRRRATRSGLTGSTV
jgi:hypothetical protein